MSLGKQIKKRRLSLELTQRDLAKALKVTPQHISAIEQDKRAPSLDSLVRFAKELGVTTDFLLTGKEVALIEIAPIIKADKKLTLKSKKAIIALVEELQK